MIAACLHCNTFTSIILSIQPEQIACSLVEIRTLPKSTRGTIRCHSHHKGVNRVDCCPHSTLHNREIIVCGTYKNSQIFPHTFSACRPYLCPFKLARQKRVIIVQEQGCLLYFQCKIRGYVHRTIVVENNIQGKKCV